MNQMNTGKKGGLTVKNIFLAFVALIAVLIFLPLLFKFVTWLVSTVIVLGILGLFIWMMYNILTHDPDAA